MEPSENHQASRKSAIEADIYAAGGYQIVGHDLKLSSDPKTAGRILSNKVNRNGRHRLSDEDALRIKQWARQRSGRSQLHELECAELKFEGGHWLTLEEIKAQRKKERQAILRRLAELEAEEE